MMQKRTLKCPPKPAALRNPAVKKKIKLLKETEPKIWDENQLKAEVTKIRGQQKRLGKLLSDLRKIEHLLSGKKTVKR